MSPNIAPRRTIARSAHLGAEDCRENPKTIPLPAESESELPWYVRLPRSGGRCRWTGLTRSSMNALVLGPNPPVKSVVVARKGASRGIRLVHLESLLEHLNGLLEQQNNGEGGANE